MNNEFVKKSRFEENGKVFETGAPVTGAVSIENAIAVGFGDGSIRFFWPDNDPLEVQAHSGAILSIASSNDGVITGGQDGRFLKISTNAEVEEIYNFGTRWVDNVAAYESMVVCSSGKNV